MVFDVSTHSRPKAAAQIQFLAGHSFRFQHTAARRRLFIGFSEFFRIYWFQHTAARRRLNAFSHYRCRHSSFNTQPPEGGCCCFWICGISYGVSTHSRPKAAERRTLRKRAKAMFQHTAARRRLVDDYNADFTSALFQHTAARRRLIVMCFIIRFFNCFNTQPPEGG